MYLMRSGVMAITLFALAANAQEPGAAADSVVADQPLASAAETAPVVNDASAELENIEPGIPSAVLTADVRRPPSSNGVMDELDLRRTEITGNQALPKVLYIVPWRKSDPGELTGKPVNTLLDEVLAPVDRTEFLRQVDYYGDLYSEDPQ
jgi:hypothetical protein